jgi:hypothetical protein
MMQHNTMIRDTMGDIRVADRGKGVEKQYLADFFSIMRILDL